MTAAQRGTGAAATADAGPGEVEAGGGGGVPAPRRRRRLPSWVSGSPALMAGVLVVLVVVFSVGRPDAFPSLANARNILNDASTLLVMAVAATFVLVAGGIDLSIGSVLVFSSVCAAKAMSGVGTDDWLTVVVGLLAALVAGLAWGVFNGFCIAVLKVPALITTLGTLGAALGVANLLTNGADVRDVPLTLIRITTGTPLGLSWLVWVAVVVTVVGALVLSLTRFGRHTYVIGSNIEAGRRAGIDVDRHLIKLYGLSGLLSGLAGMVSLTRFTTTSIGSHGTDSLSVITGVILGGTSLFGGIGTVVGTVIGIFIPAVLNNGFVTLGVQPFWQQVAIGLVLIGAVYLDQVRRRRRNRA